VNAGSVVVVVVGTLAVVAVVAWFLFNKKSPESAASHAEPSRTGSALHHGDVHDRPAGPGAEADGVAAPGSPAPGPSAEGLSSLGDQRVGNPNEPDDH
jgi:hypothetical protein